jgi:hypothetical protein
MSRKRRILILLGLALLLALCTAVAVVAYYLESPNEIKALIEQSISRATGAECSITEFSYSLNPLFVHAKGIQLTDHAQWFHLEIPELFTELSLQGSFARKSLVVKHLVISNPSLNTYPYSHVTEIAHEPAAAGFFTRLTRGLAALLLFRDIQVDDAELSGGHLNSEMGEQILTMSGIHVNLNEAKSLQVSCYGRLRWRSEEMEMTMPHLRLTTDRAISIVDPEIRMSLKGEEMTFTTPRGKAESLSGEAQVVYDRDKRLLTFNSARLSSEKLTLKQGNGSASPSLTIHFNADGFVDFSSERAGAQRFHLILNEIMEATGAFQGVAGAHAEAGVTGLVLQMNLQTAWPLLSEVFGAKPSSFEVGGAAHVTGKFAGTLEGNDWRWDCDLQARLKDSEVSFTAPDTRGRGTVTADILVKGLFPAVETTMTVAVEKAELSWKGMGVNSAKAALSASGKGLDFDVHNLSFQASEAEFILGGKRVQAPDIKARIQSGTIQFTQSQLNFQKIDIHSSLMKNLQLSVDAHNGQVTLALEGKEVGILTLAQALSLIPPDWKLEGADSLLMKGTLKEDGHWLLESKCNLDRFAFQSPDSRHAGEKISLGLHLKATGDMNQTGWATSVEGSAGEGGFLYDRIYLDLHKNSLHFQLQGDYDPSKSTANLSEFKLVLKDLLSLEAEGQLTDLMLQHPCHLRVRLPQMQLKPAFQLFFKEPLKREVPFLAELNAGGKFMAEMEFQKETKGWRLLGRCSWRDGDILGKGFTIEGIELDLPFWGENLAPLADPSFRESFRSPAGFKNEGNLFIRSIALPYLPRQSLAARARVTPNLISFIPQDSIKVTGGEVELGPISLNGLFSLSPSFLTSATLKETELAPHVSELWPHPLPGTVQARLDVLNVDGDRIQTRGNVKVRAFGGEIVLSNLGGSGIFGTTPAFLLDATWKDLNLAQLTEGTPFEKVEGILKGQVKHLEMVGGEPQRFDLFMETVLTQEVPQKISVRALENIARIGGGESPFIGLAGAFTSFFKEFPYDKIAIQASLENDVFRIDGPIKEGDKVYLVKRSGFSGVNVVNQDPDRQISFKDMVKRIKRVTASTESLPAEEQNPENKN